MARVEVVGDRLSIQIDGMDRLWSLKSRLEVPLAHVAGAEADPWAVRDSHAGVREALRTIG
jgi:hypothetical protein